MIKILIYTYYLLNGDVHLVENREGDVSFTCFEDGSKQN